jgi:hypothetical protein
MNETLTHLAQMNVDHYNNHPKQHATITVGLAVVAVVAVNKLIKRIVKDNPELRSGQYA